MRGDHVHYGLAHLPGLAGDDSPPSDYSQGHLLPEAPEGESPKFDGVEYHLHREVISEPAHKRGHTGDEEIRGGPGFGFGDRRLDAFRTPEEMILLREMKSRNDLVVAGWQVAVGNNDSIDFILL